MIGQNTASLTASGINLALTDYDKGIMCEHLTISNPSGTRKIVQTTYQPISIIGAVQVSISGAAPVAQFIPTIEAYHTIKLDDTTATANAIAIVQYNF